jgi:hypothetical protein
MVEMALSIVLLVTFMFGIMQISLAVYTYHFVSEAAREGIRYAILRGSSLGTNCSEVPGPPTCVAQASDIQTYVQSLGFPGINPNNMTVATAWTVYPTGGTCTPSASCNNPGNLVTITVKYNFPLSIPFVPAKTIAMSSTSAMVISQ